MALTPDVQKVFSRLFDHRPFLKSEINIFKEEFETKRGDQEVDQLFRALEITSEVKEVQIDKVIEACDAHLPRTIADIQVALHMTSSALSAYNQKKATRTNDRAERLAAAKTETETRLATISAIYDEKEREIIKNFEKKKARYSEQLK